MKRVTLIDFLSLEQIAQADRLSTVEEICDQVIQPNIQAINERLGQENDPMYIAYMTYFVLKCRGHMLLDNPNPDPLPG